MQTLAIPDEQETVNVIELPEKPAVRPSILKKIPWIRVTIGILCALLLLWVWHNMSAVPEREPRVMKGITFLDNTYGPEWSHKINWEALDINDSRKCILGQLEGRYEGALQKFNAQKVLVLTTVLCQVFGKAVRN